MKTLIVLIFVIPVTGLILHKMADNYNAILFTIHKLAALALCFLGTKEIIGILKNSSIGPVQIVLIILAALSVIVLFATGAIMSIKKDFTRFFPLLHTAATAVLYISMVAVIFVNRQ